MQPLPEVGKSLLSLDDFDVRLVTVFHFHLATLVKCFSNDVIWGLKKSKGQVLSVFF